MYFESIHAFFQDALAEWNDLHAFRACFNSGALGIAQIVKAAGLNDIHVKPGTGKGTVAEIPWIGFRTDALATNFMRGIYVVYLFSPTLKTVSLCLAQGVSNFSGSDELERSEGIPKPSRKDFPELQKRALAVRETLEIPARFIESEVRLGGAGTRAAAYEKSIVCAVTYDPRDLPEERVLVDDLLQIFSYAKATRPRHTGSYSMQRSCRGRNGP